MPNGRMRQVAQDGDSSYHVRDRFRKELLVITVADILALPAFEQVQPLVLCEGAESREVHNVGILDCAPDKDGGYGPYVQSERMKTGIYMKYAKELIDKGEAYYCFCDKE